MRVISSKLKETLLSSQTTLCNCWKITRNDGAVLCFTDHDTALAFDNVEFSPNTGPESSLIETKTGLSPDNLEIRGAISSQSITENDIESGLYDRAEVLQWLVDWKNPEAKYLIFSGEIGEITRTPTAFQAEMLGIAERVNQKYEKCISEKCCARLGDRECNVDTQSAAFSTHGTITTVYSKQAFGVSGLDAYPVGWFSHGTITFDEKPRIQAKQIIKTDYINNTHRIFELWQMIEEPLEISDSFFVIAGCDKNFETCKNKFNNILNFRGFPHIPGDDWVTSYPNKGENHDGRSLFRK
jgi:uncharacterized phage protein (TIGR02218 family)